MLGPAVAPIKVRLKVQQHARCERKYSTRHLHDTVFTSFKVVFAWRACFSQSKVTNAYRQSSPEASNEVDLQMLTEFTYREMREKTASNSCIDHGNQADAMGKNVFEYLSKQRKLFDNLLLGDVSRNRCDVKSLSSQQSVNGMFRWRRTTAVPAAGDKAEFQTPHLEVLRAQLG